MYSSLGITLDQLNGDLYSAWLRDTHEKNNAESRTFFQNVMQRGFAQKNVITLPNERLGINFIHSLAPLLHRSSLTKLNVHGNAIRDSGVQIIAHFLLDLPNLTELDIGANDLSGSCAFMLAQSIAIHDKLQVLIIGSSFTPMSSSSTLHNNAAFTSGSDETYINHLTPQSASILLEGCLRCRSLKVLDLSGNAVLHEIPKSTQRRQMRVVKANNNSNSINNTRCKQVQQSTSINTTTVTTNTHDKATTTSANVKQNLEAHTQEVLERRNEITDAIMSCEQKPITLLQELIYTSRILSTLRLRNVKLSAANALTLIKAMSSNTSLKAIDLRENMLPAIIGDALGNLLLARSSAHNSIPLQKVMLSGNNLFNNKNTSLKVSSRDALMTHNYYLNKFSGSSAFNSPIQQGVANKDYNNTLTQMNSNPVHNNTTNKSKDWRKQEQIDNKSKSDNVTRNKTLAKLLRLRHQSQWQQGQMLSSSQQSQQQYSTQHQQLLLSSLANDHLVKVLTLDDCGLDDTALAILCRSLINNYTLTSLSLNSNIITKQGALSLGRALCRHPCMAQLSLAHNTLMDDDGCCGLAYVLRQNESLVKLNLCNTGMNDKGLLALAQALTLNHTLHVLNVSKNQFTAAAADCFAAVLTQNTSLVTCNFTSTSISHQTLLHVQKTLRWNEVQLKDAQPNAIRKELTRLHFQKYKLDEAKNELEMLKDKNAQVKRASEHFDLQCKQDQSDYTRRIRELQQQHQNYTAQTTRCAAQQTKITADLETTKVNFQTEMAALKTDLQSATNTRKEVETTFHAVQKQLAEWNSQQAAQLRRQNRLTRLTELKNNIHTLNEERKAQRMKNEQLQSKLRLMQVQPNATKRGATKVKAASKGVAKKNTTKLKKTNSDSNRKKK